MGNQKFQFKFNHLDPGITTIEGITKMAEGNPGAAVFIGEILDKNRLKIGGVDALFMADHLQIYGSNLYVLFSDICDKDPDAAIIVLNSVMLGWLDADRLKDACSRQDYSGKEMIPVNTLRIKYFERMLSGIQ